MNVGNKMKKYGNHWVIGLILVIGIYFIYNVGYYIRNGMWSRDHISIALFAVMAYVLWGIILRKLER